MREPRTGWIVVCAAGLLLGCPADDDDSAAGDDDVGGPPVSYSCSVPTPLPAPINSAASEMGPWITDDGLALYFSSGREGGEGSADVWVARRGGPAEAWGEPVNLGPPVNGPGGQTNPAVAPGGDELVYGGNRNGNYDLWLHDRVGDGWGDPYCPEALVSDALENKPAYSPDGQRLYFKRSDATLVSDLWVSARGDDGWQPPVRLDALNDDRAQTDPALAPEGDTLFFVQGADTEAPFDVHYAVREPGGTDDDWGWVRALPGASVQGARDEGIAVGPDGREFVLVSDRDDPANKDLYTFTCERDRP